MSWHNIDQMHDDWSDTFLDVAYQESRLRGNDTVVREATNFQGEPNTQLTTARLNQRIETANTEYNRWEKAHKCRYCHHIKLTPNAWCNWCSLDMESVKVANYIATHHMMRILNGEALHEPALPKPSRRYQPTNAHLPQPNRSLART